MRHLIPLLLLAAVACSTEEPDPKPAKLPVIPKPVVTCTPNADVCTVLLPKPYVEDLAVTFQPTCWFDDPPSHGGSPPYQSVVLPAGTTSLSVTMPDRKKWIPPWDKACSSVVVDSGYAYPPRLYDHDAELSGTYLPALTFPDVECNYQWCRATIPPYPKTVRIEFDVKMICPAGMDRHDPRSFKGYIPMSITIPARATSGTAPVRWLKLNLKKCSGFEPQFIIGSNCSSSPTVSFSRQDCPPSHDGTIWIPELYPKGKRR